MPNETLCCGTAETPRLEAKAEILRDALDSCSSSRPLVAPEEGYRPYVLCILRTAVGVDFMGPGLRRPCLVSILALFLLFFAAQNKREGVEERCLSTW